MLKKYYSNNKDQLDKKVWTSNDLGDKIKVFRAMTDRDEAQTVAFDIQQIKYDTQSINNDFVVLYRTNAQSRSMEEALRKVEYPIEFMADFLLSKERGKRYDGIFSIVS